MTTDPFTEADYERAAEAIYALGWPLGKGPSCASAARAVLATVSLDQIRARAKAEALREAADFLDEASRLNPSGNTPMYISAMGLRQRADQIEEAKT